MFWGFALQYIFALVILRTSWGYQAFQWLGDRVTEFLNYSNAGATFLFGDILVTTYSLFAFRVSSFHQQIMALKESSRKFTLYILHFSRILFLFHFLNFILTSSYSLGLNILYLISSHLISLSLSLSLFVTGASSGGIFLHRDVSLILPRGDASDRQKNGHVPFLLFRNFSRRITERSRKHICRHGEFLYIFI